MPLPLDSTTPCGTPLSQSVSGRPGRSRAAYSSQSDSGSRARQCPLNQRRSRSPSPGYLRHLTILKQSNDHDLRKLTAKLESCGEYRLAVDGVWGTDRHGYPRKRCGEPDCTYCRRRRQDDEARKFTLAQHPFAWAMDTLKGLGSKAVTSSLLPKFSLSFVTINLVAIPIDTPSKQVCEVRRMCRDLIRNRMKALEKVVGVALFGHLQRSPAKLGTDVEPYLVSNPDPTALYTIIHFHGWILALEDQEKLREYLVKVIGDEPRRICLRDRYYKTQTLGESIRSVIGYSVGQDRVKHGPDPSIQLHMARVQKSLRGDKLRSSRVQLNLSKVASQLDEMWAKLRHHIWDEFEKFKLQGISIEYSKQALEDYCSWKTTKTSLRRCQLVDGRFFRGSCLDGIGNGGAARIWPFMRGITEHSTDNASIYDGSHTTHKHYSVLINQDYLICNNWCPTNTAEILLIFDHFIRKTRFSIRNYWAIGFCSRAPPINCLRSLTASDIFERCAAIHASANR